MSERNSSRHRTGGTAAGVLGVIAAVIVLFAAGVFLYFKLVLGPRVAETAYKQAAAAQVSALVMSVDWYHVDTGEYPTTKSGLAALAARPSDMAHPERWTHSFLTEKGVPLDPWDQPYRYLYPGKYNRAGIDIWSAGPDNTDGTDDDIGNWEPGTSPPPPPKAEDKRETARRHMVIFGLALDAYEIEMEELPSQKDGLTALWQLSPAAARPKEWRKFLDEAPGNDPWGQPYRYRVPGKDGRKYDVWSAGPDGKDGTDDDIGSWQPR